MKPSQRSNHSVISALEAAADTVMVVNQDDAGVIQIATTRRNSSAPSETMRLKLRVIPLDDGQTSCVLMPADASDDVAAPSEAADA